MTTDDEAVFNFEGAFKDLKTKKQFRKNSLPSSSSPKQFSPSLAALNDIKFLLALITLLLTITTLKIVFS